MCIFNCCPKSNDRKYALGNSTPYISYDCALCSKHILSKLKIHRFCGSFSSDCITKDYPLQFQLIKLGRLSQYIVCNVCQKKFELQMSNEEIFVYELHCSHQINQKKPCFCCTKIARKKCYKKCKKCGHKLLFLNQKDRVVECPKCLLRCCEFCSQEEQLFSTSYCHCKVEQTQKQLQNCIYLLLLDFLLIILLFIAFYLIDTYTDWTRIECTLIKYFYYKECNYDQFIQSLKLAGYTGIITMLSSPLPIIIIEGVKKLWKLENRLQRAKSFRNQNYIKNTRKGFRLLEH